MKHINNKSETQQDLFAFAVHQNIHPNTPGYWLDIGARNFGAGFGQNNTEFLYEHGWRGLSLDIGDFGDTYATLDPNRVTFKQLDCTDAELLIQTLKQHNVPKVVNYLSFDIDDATEQGLVALEKVIDDENYLFECITFENDAYRFSTRVRDIQRDFFTKRGYILAAELDLYEDWWIHSSVYASKFTSLAGIANNVKHNSGFSRESLQYVHNTLVSLL